MLFWLWIFPEVAGLLFVLLWPLFYRSVFQDVLHSAASKLGLAEKKAVACSLLASACSSTWC